MLIDDECARVFDRAWLSNRMDIKAAAIPCRARISFEDNKYIVVVTMQASLRIAVSLMVHCCILLLHSPPAVDGVTPTEFYPHGLLQNDGVLQRSTGSGPSYHTMLLTQAARFYGNLYSSITVSIRF